MTGVINLAVKMSISLGACPSQHNIKIYLLENVDNTKIHVLLQTDLKKMDIRECPMGIKYCRSVITDALRREKAKYLISTIRRV